MSSVDNRVVKMEFDNAEFEKNAGSTLSTLDKLKQSLNFTGAAKGMENIQNAASGVNFDALLSSVDALRGRFSVLGEFVHNTFAGIVNSAAGAAKNLFDAVTFDAAKDGFSEYELQMNSVQTIMASTGESAKTVNKYLDELNTYADKTIYSFSDMTQNIGKFTNAGVKLDDAVGAIQGISNVAAVSGANTNEASRAMYNFAQALSAGSVKLIDWKSIENANMATVEFKQALLDTGVAMGTLKKEGDKYVSLTTDIRGKTSEAFTATKNFNESLSSQWMSTDVLVQTLSNYATDIRSMTKEEKKAYEEKLRNIGYTKEQIKDIEELGQKAFDSAQDIKTFHQLIDTLKEALGSGWTKTWQFIFGDIEDAKKFWTGINKVLSDIIDNATNARNALIGKWSKDGGRADAIDSLKNSYEALLSVITPIKNAFRNVFPGVNAQDIIGYTKNLKNFTSNLKLSDYAMRNLKDRAFVAFRFLKQGFDGLKTLGGTFGAVFKSISTGIKIAFDTKFISKIGAFVVRFRDMATAIQPLENRLGNLTRFVEGVLSVLKALAYIALDAGAALWDGLGKVIMGFAPEASTLFDILGRIGDRLKDFSTKLTDIFNFKTFSGGFDAIANGLVKFWDALKKFLGIDGILESIKKFFALPEQNQKSIKILDLFKNAFSKLGEVANNLITKLGESNLDIGKILGVGAGGVILKKIWDILSNVEDGIEGIKDWTKPLAEIKDAIIDTFGSIQEKVKADMLQKIAVAIAILAGSLWVLSTIDIDKLMVSLLSISMLMDMITEMLKKITAIKLGEGGGQNLAILSGSLIALSIGILILAGAMKIMGSMDIVSLTKGIIAVTILVKQMTKVAKELASTEGDIAKGAGSLIMLAIAVGLLSIPMKILGSMSWEEISKGLVGTILLIQQLANVSNQMSEMKFGAGAGLLLMAVGISVLSKAVERIAQLSWNEMVKGLLAVILLMNGLVEAASRAPDNMLSIGAGLMLMSVGLGIIAGALKLISTINSEQMLKSMLSIVLLLSALVVAADGMKAALPGAAAMLIIASAMIPLALSLTMLSKIKATSLVKSLIGLAGALIILAGGAIVFGAIATVLAPVIPAMFGLAAALALLGVAAVSISAGGGALLLFLQQLIMTLPMLGMALAQMVAMFVAGLAANMASIVTSISTIIQAIIQLITANVPLIIETVLLMISTLLIELETFIPIIADLALRMVTAVLQAIAENIGQIVEAGINIVVNFVNGIAAGLPSIIQAAFNLIISFMDGLATAIENNSGRLAASALRLVKAIVTGIFNGIGQILKSAANVVTNFVSGITGNSGKGTTAGGNLASKVVSGIKNGIGSLWSIGRDAVQGFLNGLGSLTDSIMSKARSIANSVKNTIASALKIGSPSRVMYDIGKWVDMGLINGMKQLQNQVTSQAGSIAYGLANAIDAGVASDYNPVLTPVMDFSDTKSQVDSMAASLGGLSGEYDVNNMVDFSSISNTGDYDYAIFQQMQALNTTANAIKNKPSLQIGSFVSNDDVEIRAVVSDFVDTLIRKGLM